MVVAIIILACILFFLCLALGGFNAWAWLYRKKSPYMSWRENWALNHELDIDIALMISMGVVEFVILVVTLCMVFII